MSDARLRELERAWCASGLVRDEVALLREELRAGRVDRARLELAAWCDHDACALVLGDPASRACAVRRDWSARPDDVRLPVLARWGRDALVRGAVAMARAALDAGDAVAPVQQGARDVLRAAEAWARAPGADAAVAARERMRDFVEAMAPAAARGPTPMLWVAPAILACACIAEVDPAGRCESNAVDALAHSRGVSRDAAADLAWRAVAREVVPWALGRAGPLD